MLNDADDHPMRRYLGLARELGATDAALVDTAVIRVEDSLADRCREPRCENYGQSMSCPPHVGGPAAFRGLLQQYDQALVFKIDVPTDILLSSQRRDVFELLHTVAAGVEQAAVTDGYQRSRAFVGGSCKRIFCHDHFECRVLAGGDGCRHPHQARPSMSGHGVHVAALMQSAGWPMDVITADADPGTVKTGSITGLVLIG